MSMSITQIVYYVVVVFEWYQRYLQPVSAYAIARTHTANANDIVAFMTVYSLSESIIKHILLMGSESNCEPYHIYHIENCLHANIHNESKAKSMEKATATLTKPCI